MLAGGTEEVLAGGSATSTVISNGGALDLDASGESLNALISAGGKEVILSGGFASVTSLANGAVLQILSGGAASVTIANGGLVDVFAGGTEIGVALASGARLVDDGLVTILGARTLYGAISGAGKIATVGSAADLVLSGAGNGFSGEAVISGGTMELAGAKAIGSADVVFAAASSPDTLQIDAAAAPAAGGTFANVISNFSGANDFIDLRSIAFVSGATASVSGSTLVLSDGGKTYKFTVAGSIGSVFPVTSDGHGGTLIDPHVAGFAQATAGFSPPSAAIAGPVSAGGTSGFAGVLHATASAGGRA
jgi:autotransporter passenger strand-loop-strand repeat protein